MLKGYEYGEEVCKSEGFYVNEARTLTFVEDTDVC